VFKGLKNLIRRSPERAGGKADMEGQAAAAPAGAPFDMEKLGELIGTKIDAAVAAATKPLQDQIAKLQAPAAPAAEAPKPDPAAKEKPLTMADVQKALTDALAAQQATTATKAARDGYAADKLKDLPAVYRNQLPNTADAGELARAEQTIRAQYLADLKASGITPPPVAGTPPGNGAAATKTPADYSKMTGSQLLAEGIKQRPVATVTAETAALAEK
jgi:hypothetical protein